MSTPPDRLANIVATEAYRPVDDAFARWVKNRTGSALLARVARAVCAAEGQGHACINLGQLLDDEALAQLRGLPWVGTGNERSAFVLDAQGRFYLWRNWQHEREVAHALWARAHGNGDVTPSLPELLLDDLFGGPATSATQRQRDAVLGVLGSRLFVLTGGPGTGKTTTVLRMLLAVLWQSNANNAAAWPRIALAAPTGKAAQRLAQAIAHGKRELQNQLADSPLASLLPHVPHADARTLHRLLGYLPREQRYRHGRDNPLGADIVVLDEASMVDLASMRSLLDAMRPDALLILVGDPDQLASIDTGSVLADIVASSQAGQTTASPLAGTVHTLTHVWRAGSDLQQGILAVRDGHPLEWSTTTQVGDDLALQLCAQRSDLERLCERWLDAHADLYAELFSTPLDPQRALFLLRQAQVLSALRDGPFGAQGLNVLMTRLLALRYGFDATRRWYSGRPVIVAHNDYARGLYNGDVGIALAGADGLRVWFEVAADDGQSRVRSYSPRALPAHDTAWAITIHRSQGSEYRDVAVVLPPHTEQRILSRELIYTAVSRARRRAELWTTPTSLPAALEHHGQRESGLPDRLRQLSGTTTNPTVPSK